MCRIEYEIPEAGNVTIKVVDIIGTPVRVLMSDHEKAGKYFIDLNEESLRQGKYYYKIYLNTLKNGSVENTDKNLITTGQVKL